MNLRSILVSKANFLMNFISRTISAAVHNRLARIELLLFLFFFFLLLPHLELVTPNYIPRYLGKGLKSGTRSHFGPLSFVSALLVSDDDLDSSELPLLFNLCSWPTKASRILLGTLLLWLWRGVAAPLELGFSSRPSNERCAVRLSRFRLSYNSPSH